VRSASCTGGSANNPISCSTTNCPPGDAACCRPDKPLCTWNFTSPASQGSYYSGFLPGQLYCAPPDACDRTTNFDVLLNRPTSPQACTSSPVDYLFIRLPRPMPSGGRVFSLPTGGVSLLLNITDATRSCSNWTGSLTWHSDVPSWRVTLDATCTEVGKSHIRLIGTVRGEL
jgi:hypothetical protein